MTSRRFIKSVANWVDARCYGRRGARSICSINAQHLRDERCAGRMRRRQWHPRPCDLRCSNSRESGPIADGNHPAEESARSTDPRMLMRISEFSIVPTSFRSRVFSSVASVESRRTGTKRFEPANA